VGVTPSGVADAGIILMNAGTRVEVQHGIFQGERGSVIRRGASQQLLVLLDCADSVRRPARIWVDEESLAEIVTAA
jgi:hypothetical protein